SAAARTPGGLARRPSGAPPRPFALRGVLQRRTSIRFPGAAPTVFCVGAAGRGAAGPAGKLTPGAGRGQRRRADDVGCGIVGALGRRPLGSAVLLNGGGSVGMTGGRLGRWIRRRSEERRVGKGGGGRWRGVQQKQH